MTMSERKTTSPPLRLVSEADGAILWDGAGVPAAVTEVDSGVEFDAVTFWERPNRNHVRIRRDDLAAFAASFVGAPFLRNHAEGDIGEREGIVLASAVEERLHPVDGALTPAVRQRLRITTQRGRRALQEGQIDRFSVAFDVTGWVCSVCGADWLHCSHWPGEQYDVNGQPTVCEIVAVQPHGREVSAVNVPAVDGTGLLQALCACKEHLQKEAEMSEELRIEMGEGEKGRAGEGEPMPVAVPASSMVLSVAPDEKADALVALQAIQTELAAVQRMRLELEAERRETQIRTSGLSEQGQQVVRLATLHGGDVEALIEAQRAAEAALASPVKGNRPLAITGMQTPEDRMQEIFNWAMGLSSAPPPPPSMRSVRDLYLAITGDFDFHGKFVPSQAQLAASTVTLPSLAVNALNKVVLQHYASMMTWRWFEPLVEVVPHDGTTHDVQLIMVDGVANLSTVAEGAAYTELTVGDSKEVVSFDKRGNFVGITLEMFRRSDIAKLQAIPRALMAASLRTRSATVAAIFTANGGVGPTLVDDGKALFHADHGNLANTAFSAAAWAAARQRIWKQTVPGTGKPLSLWPTFCLVPIDLYDTALEVFGYGDGEVP